MDFLNKIFDIVVSPELQRALLPIKIVFVAFGLLLVGAIIFLLLKSTYLDHIFLYAWRDYARWKAKGKMVSNKVGKKREKPKREILDRTESTDWQRILDKIESKNELNYKLALLDSDKLLSYVLKEQGKELSPKNVSNYEQIKKARALLEKMMTSPKARLKLEEVKKIIEIYRQALSELKTI